MARLYVTDPDTIDGSYGVCDPDRNCEVLARFTRHEVAHEVCEALNTHWRRDEGETQKSVAYLLRAYQRRVEELEAEVAELNRCHARARRNARARARKDGSKRLYFEG